MSKSKKSSSHFYVSHERVCSGYALLIEVGKRSTEVIVPASDIIEYTDSKEQTFGIDDNDNVIMERCRVGQRAFIYPIHDYIEDYFSANDWMAFAQTLPAYKALKKPPTNLRVLATQARYAANNGRYDSTPGYASRTPAKPVWWAYDVNGKWLMVDGVKVEIDQDDAAEYIGKRAFVKRDEKGFYGIQYRRDGNRKLYFSFDTMVQMANESLWWDYSQELAAKVAV